MRRPRRKLTWLLVCLLVVASLPVAFVLAPGSVALAANPSIREFSIPTTKSNPKDIAAGPDGALWFAESTANQIARITTTTDVVTEFHIPTASSFPVGIVAGSDGALWFTEYSANQIGRVTTAGSFSKFQIPTASSAPGNITAGPDGRLWFTEGGANQIGRISTSGSIKEFHISTASSRPFDIAAGPDGALWFTEEGANQIGRITTSGSINEFLIPTANSFPIGIAAGPDGALWFTEENASKIGRITTSGSFKEFPIPAANSSVPFAIAAGPDGALWFTDEGDTNPVGRNHIGRITTSGSITEFPIPTANSVPSSITAGPDGALWFTEGAANQIGQVSSPTVTTVDCSPSSLFAGDSSICEATVIDTASLAATPPTGSVAFFTTGSGTFSANSCTLASTGVTACQVNYHAGATAEKATITATYQGDSSHTSSSGTVLLTIAAVARSWPGEVDSTHDPSDSTGAIGPTRYIELVNAEYGIYDRAGNELSRGSFGDLVSLSGVACSSSDRICSDPQVLWDQYTRRFYYSFVVTDQSKHYHIVVGFSKTDSPQSKDDFCNASINFGKDAPDQPHLGDSADFLLIGYNLVAPAPVGYFRSDVAWLTKPSGTGAITNCASWHPWRGSFSNLTNADGKPIGSPVPAQNADSSAGRAGYVLATAQTQNYPSNFISIFTVVKGSKGRATIVGCSANRNKACKPSMTVHVDSFNQPQPAQQTGSGTPLDTTDSRLGNAIGAVDPDNGNKFALWTQHTVYGGAGAEVAWYEIDPQSSQPMQQGFISDPSLYIFNAAIAPDRAAALGTGGGDMALTFNTSSATTPVTVQVLYQLHGPQAPSRSLIIGGSTSPDQPTCPGDPTNGAYRWGDYSGASPDPAQASTVWFTNMFVARSSNVIFGCADWGTFNWSVVLG